MNGQDASRRSWPDDAFPEWRWDVISKPTVRDGRGPERVQTDEKPDPDFKRRPAGFTAELEPVEEADSGDLAGGSGSQAGAAGA